MRELLFGRQAVREALRAGKRAVFRLWLAEKSTAAPILEEIVQLAQRRQLPVEIVRRADLDARLNHSQHQGVVLEAASYAYVSLPDLLAVASRSTAALFLLLDVLQDIHNLGSLLRTAEAVGVNGVILQERRAVGVTPAVVNTSAGAVEHLAIAQVTNLARAIAELKAASVWVAGLEGTPEARLYTTADLRGPLGIVVGSEGQGLRRLVRERCDYLLALPMYGQINSLNAAVAGSIALYEVVRQRQSHLEASPLQ